MIQLKIEPMKKEFEASLSGHLTTVFRSQGGLHLESSERGRLGKREVEMAATSPYFRSAASSRRNWLNVPGE